ncbi:hypothetical protein [Paenibacillus chitinolyticus]|uniref:hypothetical protein n=1 Tax=Paenibacillus chitinolyticus TaxID=79263 RepID=UPI003D066AD3
MNLKTILLGGTVAAIILVLAWNSLDLTRHRSASPLPESSVSEPFISEPAAGKSGGNQLVNESIEGEAAVLTDAETGKLLFGKNKDLRLYPASTTKIVTALSGSRKRRTPGPGHRR